MLKLVSTQSVMLSRANSFFVRVKSVFSLKILFALFLLTAGAAHAQDITMPTVEIDGVDEDSDGASIVITVIKFIAKISIWIVMVIAGLVCLKNILKSWNEQKNNDQGKWGAVVGDSLGSVIMVLLVIALGTWALTFIS